MDFLKLVTDARSCRRFEGAKELETGSLEWLIDCVRLSPSAANAQVLRFATIQDEAARAGLYPSLGWAGFLKDWDGPIESERPTGYILILHEKKEGEKTGPNTWIDLGIACQCIQSAAMSKGIGACIFRNFNPKVIAAAVDIPEGYEILAVIALGYPVEERAVVPVGADGSTRYYRDENGVHYVPKRDLKDIILKKC